MSSQTVLPTTEQNNSQVQDPLPLSQPLPAPEKPKLPKATIADLLFALALLAGGFLFWHYLDFDFFTGRGLGTSLFFLCTIATCFAYLLAKGIKQNLKSWIMLAAALLGALPFVLYGTRDINFLLVSFEVALCLLWVMYSCRTEISKRLNLTLIGDLLHQFFVVPFMNFGLFFTHSLSGLKSKKTSWRYAVFAAIGLLVSLPVFFIVVSLLASSDDGFGNLVRDAFAYLVKLEVFRYLIELILAIPVAAYIFGAVFGNFAKRHTDALRERDLLAGFASAHAIPKAFVYAPLVLFVALYVVYFIAVGSYLFSGLQGQLPVVYTYAEYARRGFFELCVIAAINLIALGAIWLLVKRQDREYPPLLRVLTGALSLLTCLLIVTALSKMFIYIQAYGLTSLRLYTTWFMLFLLVAFCLIVAWHVKTFNAARPIIVLTLLFTLGLGLMNTNAIIANYNVERYLSGATERIDVRQLESIGHSAVPALTRLEQDAQDEQVKSDARSIIDFIHSPYDSSEGKIVLYDYLVYGDWTAWNLERHKAMLLRNLT